MRLKTTKNKKTIDLNHLMNHLEPDTQHSLNRLITESSAQFLTDIYVLDFLWGMLKMETC